MVSKVEIIVPSVHMVYDPKETRKALRAMANKAAQIARRATRNRSGSGRRYRYNGKSITASAPGQAPIQRTGTLSRSIRVRSGKRLAVFLQDRAYYATMMETGSEGGGGRKGNTNRKNHRGTRRVQAPRPFLQTAAEQATPNMGSLLEKAIAKSLELKMRKSNVR